MKYPMTLWQMAQRDWAMGEWQTVSDLSGTFGVYSNKMSAFLRSWMDQGRVTRRYSEDGYEYCRLM